MIRILSALILLMTYAGTCSSQGEVEPDNLKLHHYKISAIKQVAVTRSTVLQDSSPTEECHAYNLTPKRVTYFFKNAREVTRRDAMHLYTDSTCHGTGTVTFSNGDRATWTISRGGVGYLGLTNGRFRDKLIALYCHKCDAQDW